MSFSRYLRGHMLRVLRKKFPHGKMCEKFISNKSIFAAREIKRDRENNFLISKGVTQTVTQSVIHEVKK